MIANVTTARLSAVGFLARLASVGFGVANLLLVSRVLGPEGRGEYVLALTALTVLSVLADAGLSMSAQSLAGGSGMDPARLHRMLLVAVAPATALALAAGAGAAFLGARATLAGVGEEPMFLVAAILPAAIYGRYWVALMVGLRRIVDAAQAQIVFAVSLLIFDVMLLVVIPGGVSGAMLAYLLASLGQALFMLARAPRASARSAPAPTPLKSVLEFGLRSYPTTVGGLVWSAFPPIAVNLTAGTAAVGLFSLAQQLAERAVLPILALYDTAYSRMSALGKVDAAAATVRYAKLALVATLAVSALVILASHLAIPLLFGEAFRASAGPLQILMAAAPFTSLGLLLTPYVVAQARRPGLLSLVTWAQVGILLVITLALASGLDIVRIALASAAAQAGACIAMLVIFARLSGIPPRRVLSVTSADLRLGLVALRSAGRQGGPR